MLILALGSRVNEVNQERKYDVAVALDPFYVLRRTRLRSSVSQETDLGLPHPLLGAISQYSTDRLDYARQWHQ